MNLTGKVFTVFFFMIMLSCTSGGDPDIRVEDAKLMPSPMIVGGGSAFMVIRNNGKGNDVLTGCSIKEFHAAAGMLHDYEDGKMKMVHEIDIPAGGTVELKRGAKHLMFSGLPELTGDSVTIMMNFRKSGPVEVKANINVPEDAGQ